MSLQLRTNNLYRTGAVTQFSNGEQLLTREQLTLVGDEEDKYHLVREGDDLTILAWRYYRKIGVDVSKYWWIIADANNIHNPLDLSDLVGTEILIPNLTNTLLLL